MLRLELGAILSTAIVAARVGPGLKAPLLLKVMHFIFVGVYSLIGIGGIQIMLWMCLHHRYYVEVFSHSNPFGVSASVLQFIGYLFAPTGAVLCIAALRLGALRNWAREAVVRLALPYSILYPGIMITIATNALSSDEIRIVFIITVFMAALSVFAMIFYKSKVVTTHFGFVKANRRISE